MTARKSHRGSIPRGATPKWKRDVGRAKTLRFFEIALVLVRFDHITRLIVNVNHGIMRPAAVLRVIDCRARVLIPQSTKRQCVTD